MSNLDLRQVTAPRKFGFINWLGLWTLYKKEVRRFMKVVFQTVLAPVVTVLLFMVIFAMVLSEARPDIGGIPFAQFIAPGLILMGVLNNAFANSSSTLLVSKVQGNTVDFLMPPLSALELFLAFVGGAMTRGFIVALASGTAMAFFVPLWPEHVWAVVFYGLSAAAMLAMVGVIAGIWAEKFDPLAVVSNFIIMPLTFLSGTFYSVAGRGAIETISHFNPFFYMIDGFRYGFTGHADGSLTVGVLMTLAINITLAICCYGVLRAGWRLKS